MKTLEEKRKNENEIVFEMIKLYCTKKHKCKNGLCSECKELNEYAVERTEKCPFMETKTFCSNCKVHCYNKEMREKIKRVMGFSGPRMIFHHPILAIRHLILSLRNIA